MWRKVVFLLAVLALLGSFSFAESQPSSGDSSGTSVTLSQADYQKVLASVEAAKAALEQSNKEIAKQSTDLTMLKISCGVLVVIDLGAVTLGLFEALKK